MRLLITADLHYNHGKGHALADDLIDQMNSAGGDVLLVVGDTATADGPALEQCLSRFKFTGPKLFVAGNHELWTHGPDSYAEFREVFPKRVRDIGWQWLQTEPFVQDELAIVGSIGWYDYSFAEPNLGIPQRFYAAKVSPGAAEHLGEHKELMSRTDDVPDSARHIIARWNDGKFVKLHRSDEQFMNELLAELKSQLDSLLQIPNVVAAIHHLPFAQLLPPSHRAQWDFAKAYLGSGRIGELLLKYQNVQTVLCGHSHFAAEATIEHVHAINIGSGYRAKKFLSMDIL
jgi:predicted phosphodiesterase